MANDKKDEKLLQQRKEEVQLVNRFRNVATARLEQLASQVEDSGNKLKLGEEEKNILTQMHGMGLKEGIAAGCLSFLILRKGPIYIGRYVMRRRQQSGNFSSSMDGTPPLSGNGGYKLADPRATPANPFQQASSSTANPHFPRSRSFVVRSFWFMFDSVLSLMMAASVSMQYTDTKKIRQGISELPLIPGRSLASDALCDGIVAELQKVIEERNPVYERLQKGQPSQDKDAALTEPVAFYLTGIIDFSSNCQRRAFRERELRQEQGLGSNDAVEIPSPGVARDGPRLVKDIHDGSEKVEHDNDSTFGQETSFGDDFDADWASNFVADQEDDNSK